MTVDGDAKFYKIIPSFDILLLSSIIGSWTELLLGVPNPG